jgi:hypothetical protein
MKKPTHPKPRERNMDEQKRRKHERKDSLNLIDYLVLDQDGEPLTRRMGRTLNVSEGGCLLETHIPLKKGQEVQLTAALDEQIMELEGTIVHVKPCGEKGFCSGIQFKEMKKEGKEILKKYIEALRAAGVD